MSFMVAGAVSSIPAMAAVWSLVKPRVFATYLGLGDHWWRDCHRWHSVPDDLKEKAARCICTGRLYCIFWQVQPASQNRGSLNLISEPRHCPRTHVFRCRPLVPTVCETGASVEVTEVAALPSGSRTEAMTPFLRSPLMGVADKTVDGHECLMLVLRRSSLKISKPACGNDCEH